MTALAAAAKYRRYLTLGYQCRMEFRFSVFCSIAVFMFPLAAKIIFWKAVYGSGSGEIAGFNVADMVTYLLVHQCVFELTWAYPGYGVRRNIVSGGLSGDLVRPVDYLSVVFFRGTGTMFPRITSTLGIFAVLIALFAGSVNLPAEAWIYPAGIVSIVLCYVLSFMYSFLIGLFAFWTESDPPLAGHVRALFCGAIVPLAFLPDWLQAAAEFLPFKYTLYFPTMLLLGKVRPLECARGVGLQVFWIIVCLVAIRLVWKRGIRRYAAYGG
jgi:ABC-2 type transport system permease protein